MCNKEITQFYLPPTHEPYLPLLPSRRTSSPFGWYNIAIKCAYARRDGQAELTWVAGWPDLNRLGRDLRCPNAAVCLWVDPRAVAVSRYGWRKTSYGWLAG